MSEIVANDHHATITTNDFALVANLLHAWFNLHDQTPFFLFTSLLLLVYYYLFTTTCTGK
jgi:hypothetical protein